MGQYYFPVNLDKKEWLLSHDTIYHPKIEGLTGLKLMEHSWVGTHFISIVENLLKSNGEWHKTRLVWLGDYSDDEALYSQIREENKKSNYKKLNLKSLSCDDVNYQYLVNHSKKEFVNKTLSPKDKDNWQIHPLPLLTCEGNGRGGGDYCGNDPQNLIGSWSRDIISIESEKPEDFKEIRFDLIEG